MIFPKVLLCVSSHNVVTLHYQGQVPFVEGQSAALDLMESFGFEGAIESVSPTNPGPSFLGSAITGVCQSGPTLLDLTLPNSPSETVQEGMYLNVFGMFYMQWRMGYNLYKYIYMIQCITTKLYE